MASFVGGHAGCIAGTRGVAGLPSQQTRGSRAASGGRNAFSEAATCPSGANARRPETAGGAGGRRRGRASSAETSPRCFTPLVSEIQAIATPILEEAVPNLGIAGLMAQDLAAVPKRAGVRRGRSAG